MNGVEFGLVPSSSTCTLTSISFIKK